MKYECITISVMGLEPVCIIEGSECVIVKTLWKPMGGIVHWLQNYGKRTGMFLLIDSIIYGLICFL